MVFSSTVFLFFYLPAVLLLYVITPFRWRNLTLLAVSLVFYGWGEPLFVLLMVFTTAVNYAAGLLVDKYRDNPRKKRAALLLSVIVSLGLLFFFKYYDFLAETFNRLPFLSFWKPLNIPLPIGISFYTFQTMSYTIDVYRNDTPVQKSIIRLGTYVTLFPQLIAGPIVRYHDVADQMEDRRLRTDQFASGVRRFVLGLAKKVLLANNIGLLWDAVAAEETAHLSVAGAWLGIIAFAFQIYFDFSGYSDMAIGLGRMFGFEFLENFNFPYISRSVTEFWRRWHISLGTWFREYVYIPLGGNRRGKGKQLRNILIVWALTGIWHGASWNFLLWGLYYALWLIAEKLFLLSWLERAPRWVGRVYTLLAVLFGWALFAVEDISRLGGYFAAMLGVNGAGLAAPEVGYWLGNYGVLLIILAVCSTPLLRRLYARLPARVRAVATPVLTAVLLVACTAYVVDASYNPFLYFRF